MMGNGSKSRRFIFVLAIILYIFPASYGQDLSSVIPGLQGLPAPDWVREGIRLSYYSATADVPSANEKFILDEEGDWVGMTSGKKYRREELFGAAGHGVTQVDVLSVDQRVAALKVNSWLYSSYTGPLTPIKQAPAIGLAAGGDWYIHPDALAKLADRRGGSVTILRMPYTVEGVTYNAIRIQQDSETSTFAHIYDLQDGKLLATFNSVASADKLSTVFAYATFLGVRQMALPWAGQVLPDWLKKGAVLQYSGTKTYEAILAAYSMPTSVTVGMRIKDATTKYYTYTQSGSMSVPGFPSQYGQELLAGGLGEPVGLVLPPASLARLQTGQIIDVDPITGITVTVTDIIQDYSGRDLVVIEASNQVYSTQTTYDMNTGAMIRFNEVKHGVESNEYTDLELAQEDINW
jgi:hypothetical protein